MVIPQTRQPIQIFINKGIALFSPSVVKESNREVLANYNWQLEDIEGNDLNLNQSKNRVILVNLWATWCPPCIAEMPSMNDLYVDYNDKIDFYFISNEKAETLRKFIDKNGYSFPVQIPKSMYPNEFDISSIPRTYLIDKSGQIVIDKKGAANWNSKKVRLQIDKLIAD